MAYNIPERYSDLTPAPQLDKKTLNKMVWMSCFLQASFNYERMQACGWLWGILPGLKKIHTNKEDLKASMAHNLDFLNTHPFLVTFVMGIESVSSATLLLCAFVGLAIALYDYQINTKIKNSAGSNVGGVSDGI